MTTQAELFDIVVIGGGPGGIAAATAAASKGMQVALINDGLLMGNHLEAAFKSKVLYEISRIHFSRQTLSRIAQPRELYDYLGAYQARQASAEGLRKLERQKLLELGIELLEGRGSFCSPHEVKIGERRLRGSFFIIATGTRPYIPDCAQPIPNRILTYHQLLNIDHPLKSLTILGGGRIGCEFAAIFAALGTEITLLEPAPRILSNEDPDVSELLTHCLEVLGVRVHSHAVCLQMTTKEDRVVTMLEGGNQVATEVALLATGRMGNTSDLGLEHVGLETDERGYIPTFEGMQTAIPHIYAVGDVATRDRQNLRLVPIAEAQGNTAIAHILREKPTLSYRHIPFVVFSHPVFAGVGDSEQEARARFGDIRIGKWAHAHNHRSYIMLSQRGFVKLIVAPRGDDRILGIRAIGPGAEQVTHEVSLMIRYGLPYTHLLTTPSTYPSFSESLHGAAKIIARKAAPSKELEAFEADLLPYEI